MPRIKHVDWRATYTTKGVPYHRAPGVLALRATSAQHAAERAQRVAMLIDPTAVVVLVERVR